MKRISLDQLCGGAVLERFAMGLAQIGTNIMDPNTNAEKARKITVTFTFKPDKSRASIKTNVDMNVKLAPPEADETLLLIGQDLRSGRIEISEYGNRGQSVETKAEYMVQAETIPPQAAQQHPEFDRETGEIYEPKNGPIDLRNAANY